MPTGRNNRRPINVRVTHTAVNRLDQRAADEHLYTERGEPNRSELVRIMLAYADRHMPRGWRP